MESASTIEEGGTSLALADYYAYVELSNPIDPSQFALPPLCNQAIARAWLGGARRRRGLP